MFEQEIGFDPEAIAEVLRARAEKSSRILIADASEIGIDLTRENVWEIFLFDSLTGIEQYLMLYADRRVAMLHSRININGDRYRPSMNIDLGSLQISGINRVSAVPQFGHVRFISERETGNVIMDVWHNCRYAFSADVSSVDSKAHS